MTINVEKIIENEDGSANVEFDMSYEELVEFARIAILQTLSDAAKHTIIQEEWIGECFELVKGAEDTEENYISLVEDQLKHEAEVKEEYNNVLNNYDKQVEENRQLRHIISDVVSKLPFGGYVSPLSPIEFMALVPGELESQLKSLLINGTM